MIQSEDVAYKRGFALLNRVKKLNPKVWVRLIIVCGLYTGVYSIRANFWMGLLPIYHSTRPCLIEVVITRKGVA